VAAGTDSRREHRTKTAYGSLAMTLAATLETIVGQEDGSVQFVGRGRGITGLLAQDEIKVVIPLRAGDPRNQTTNKVPIRPAGVRNPRGKPRRESRVRAITIRRTTHGSGEHTCRTSLVRKPRTCCLAWL
jgi:hypothetical protein